MIGTFGPITFKSSNTAVRTFRQFKRKRASRWATHNVFAAKPRLEHIGSGLDTVSFGMQFDVSLGVSPEDELKVLQDIKESAENHPLIIGGDPLGRFVIFDFEETWTAVDKSGRIIRAEVSINMTEYDDG